MWWINAPTFASGRNIAEITLPPGLPRADGFLGSFLISGVFGNDCYRNLGDLAVGTVLHSDSSGTARLEVSGVQRGAPASCWCSFTYVTSAR